MGPQVGRWIAPRGGGYRPGGELAKTAKRAKRAKVISEPSATDAPKGGAGVSKALYGEVIPGDAQIIFEVRDEPAKSSGDCRTFVLKYCDAPADLAERVTPMPKTADKK